MLHAQYSISLYQKWNISWIDCCLYGKIRKHLLEGFMCIITVVSRVGLQYSPLESFYFFYQNIFILVFQLILLNFYFVDI
jgi:hypothetical protein